MKFRPLPQGSKWGFTFMPFSKKIDYKEEGGEK